MAASANSSFWDTMEYVVQPAHASNSPRRMRSSGTGPMKHRGATRWIIDWSVSWQDLKDFCREHVGEVKFCDILYRPISLSVITKMSQSLSKYRFRNPRKFQFLKNKFGRHDKETGRGGRPRSKGCALVQFEDPNHAKRAIDELRSGNCSNLSI